MNTIILIGRLTRTVDIRNTSTGKKIAEFSLAVNKNKETTFFFNCTAWEKTAELLQNYTVKGDKVGIEGELQSEKYTKKDGTIATKTFILVTQVELLAERKEGNIDTQNVSTPF